MSSKRIKKKTYVRSKWFNARQILLNLILKKKPHFLTSAIYFTSIIKPQQTHVTPYITRILSPRSPNFVVYHVYYDGRGMTAWRWLLLNFFFFFVSCSRVFFRPRHTARVTKGRWWKLPSDFGLAWFDCFRCCVTLGRKYNIHETISCRVIYIIFLWETLFFVMIINGRVRE